MLEIPETITIAHQAESILVGKTITNVIEASSPHRFAWYSGDVKKYASVLIGRQIEASIGHGAFVSLCCDNDVRVSVSDGVNLKYYPSIESHPKKHQLLIEFDDKSFLAFTVSMYGCIYALKGISDHPYYRGSLEKLSPLDDTFDDAYFEGIFKSVSKDISIKALLATEQRIPGLGNGVLQDILFKSGVHPKKKISTINDLQKSDLFHTLKFTLESMTEKGGRNTEKDFYGNKGGYECLLSRNTYKDPCPNCGDTIVKEAYLGGSVYYCPTCQQL